MNAFSAGKLTFYDAVNVIHDVITTHNPIPYTVKPVLETTCFKRPVF